MSTIFIGDSIVAWWNLPQYFDNAVNRGKPGETPQKVSERFVEDVITEQPDSVVILCGTNAPYSWSVPYIEDMAEQAREEGIKIILCRIPPRGFDVSDFNTALLGMALYERLVCVDFFGPMRLSDGSQNPALFHPDGTHPNSSGYDVMAGILRPAVNALLTPPMSAIQREALWLAQ